MKKLNRNIQFILAALLVLAIGVGFGLYYQMVQSQTTLLAVAGENKASLRKLYSQAGEIYSRDGVALASSESGDRVYAEDTSLQRSVSHFVGDYTHHMSNTIETQYQNQLLGKNRNLFDQLVLDVSGNGLQGDDIYLTINSQLNAYAYDLLAQYKGAVVVMNYQTGEIVAMASTPATNMENIINYTDIPDTALFNRAVSGQYAPGSTWKIMTTAAWLNSDVYNPNYTLVTDGTAIRPNGATDIESKGINGEYELQRAFTQSVNTFYGELAVMMGQEAFQDYIDSSGISSLTSLGKLNIRPARVDSSAAAEDAGLLSWFGIGQPAGDLVLTMTPIEMANLTAAVANGGQLLDPYLVDYVSDPLGRTRQESERNVRQTAFDVSTANYIKNMMIEAINSPESIQSNVGIEGFTVGGKSGTAQVEGSYPTASWTGFLDHPDYPYAVAVIVEEAQSTSAIGAIGNALLLQAIRLGLQ